MKIGFTAWRIALPGFIVPFLFVYNPGLLLEGPLLNIILSIGVSALGFGILISGLAGYFRERVKRVDRILLVASGGLCFSLSKFNPFI